MSCSTRNDIILGSINICREKRGRGYGTRLIHAVLKDCALDYENAYEFIHEDNLPSIRSAEKNGYILIGRGVYCGLLKNVEVNDTGYLLIYKKHAD